MNKRASGILLHITSLPSKYGIGDLGSESYKFVDFLKATGQSYWQILPLTSTIPATGNSPYTSLSTFAGNTLLISPDQLLEEGLLTRKDIINCPITSLTGKIDFNKVIQDKTPLYDKAYSNFCTQANVNDFNNFCAENNYWLNDYTLFIAIKEHFNSVSWHRWPKEFKYRDHSTLNDYREKLSKRIEKEKFLQFIFFKQWQKLRNYCAQNKIKIIGDLPIYVNYDSSDVWTHPELFKLNQKRRPTHVSGVPPDYFSKTGQYWGTPVYNWDVNRELNYGWWIERLKNTFNLCDITRIDHFRGFVGYWEIKAAERTAINGQWVPAPAKDFFSRVKNIFADKQIIAEDLGLITDDVREVINQFHFPGMRVILFAFNGDVNTNPHAPHNYIENCVAYTGTHDNNTILGWFAREASSGERKNLFKYLNNQINRPELNWQLIELVMKSRANTAVIPLQDVLGLGSKARMNRPSFKVNNWRWQLVPNQITPQIKERLLEVTKASGRIV